MEDASRVQVVEGIAQLVDHIAAMGLAEGFIFDGIEQVALHMLEQEVQI